MTVGTSRGLLSSSRNKNQ